MTAYAIGVLVTGIVLIVVVAVWQEKGPPILLHVLRDIGIALIVAIVVTVVFELYEHTRERVVSTEREIDARMGDQLTPEVWKDIKEQILDKHLLRRNAEMRVIIQPDPDLLSDQRLVHIEFSYDLYNISAPNPRMTVVHSLAFPQYLKTRRPRFELTRVENADSSTTVWTPEQLDQASRKGYEELPLNIPRNAHVHISTRRVELANVPGTYNLYMNEYTAGFRLHVEGGESFRTNVRVRPYGHAQILAGAGENDWTFDRLLLPGQGVELMFSGN